MLVLSTLGFLSGFATFVFFQFTQMHRRMDRLEIRMDRLEDRMDRLEDRLLQLGQEIHSLDLRVSKLEWMLDAALYGKPVRIPPESDNGDPN